VLGVLEARAVILGLAVGVLASGLTFALVALIARTVRSETLAGLALSLSVLVGFGLGGLVAGRLAPANGRFHGSITALIVAGIVITVASLGGSPAPLGSVLLLALLAILIGGIAGSLGARRRSKVE
jgi:putative membrane protein (TIGR04086 family)